MKPAFIISFLLFSSLLLRGQNIENPSFDSVYIGGIDRIHAWITSDGWPGSSLDTVQPLNPNDHYVSVGLQYHELLYSVQLEYTNAYDGPYAIKVLSDTGRVDIFGNPFRGFVVNGDHFYTDSTGYLDLKKCGTPFTYRPNKLIGHYKLEDNSPSMNNYPEAVVLLKKYNTLTQSSDTIGFATASMTLFPTATWRAFEMPINYISSQIPDSIVVAFFSPPLGYSSTFWVDSLGFDYTSTVINERPVDLSPSFYVNGIENKIYFTSPEKIETVNIYSSTGQLVLNLKEPASSIDISNLRKGIYLISFNCKNKSTVGYKFTR